MSDVTINRRMWLRIAQFPPLRLAVFGVVMFYMLGYSNKFIGGDGWHRLLQIAVVIGWSAVGFAVYIAWSAWSSAGRSPNWRCPVWAGNSAPAFLSARTLPPAFCSSW